MTRGVQPSKIAPIKLMGRIRTAFMVSVETTRGRLLADSRPSPLQQSHLAQQMLALSPHFQVICNC